MPLLSYSRSSWGTAEAILTEHRKRGFTKHKLPDPMYFPIGLSDGDRYVGLNFDHKSVAIFRKGTWQTLKLTGVPENIYKFTDYYEGGDPDSYRKAVLSGEKSILIGNCQDLLSIDLKTGACSISRNDWGSPNYSEYTDFKPILIRKDRQGRTWVVQTDSTVRGSESKVFLWNGQSWRLFARTHESPSGGQTPMALWNPKITTGVVDLAFGSMNEPFVLTRMLGVMKWDGTKWIQCTRGWGGWDFGYGVERFCLLDNDTAYIGFCSDIGVILVWKFSTNTASRLILKDGRVVPDGERTLHPAVVLKPTKQWQ